MPGKFELKKSSDGQFMFNLKAGNGEVILTSELYTTKASAEKGITAVKMNSPVDDHFELRTSIADEPYFVLKASNREIIGTSEMYSSTSATEKGIQSVKDNGPESATDDTC